MRLVLWMLTSLVFTLVWWLLASTRFVADPPLAYFGVGILGIVALAWVFDVFRHTRLLARTILVSSLSMVVLAMAFLVVVVVAGSTAPTADSITAMKPIARTIPRG